MQREYDDATGPRAGVVDSSSRASGTPAATSAAATARARSAARTVALCEAGSTSCALPSVPPVTVSRTRGSRSSPFAQPSSASGRCGSAAEPGAKSATPWLATGIAAGAGSTPNPCAIPRASSRGDSV